MRRSCMSEKTKTIMGRRLRKHSLQFFIADARTTFSVYFLSEKIVWVPSIKSRREYVA
jgi:hypothetical protein